jgi:hypothetical protein
MADAIQELQSIHSMLASGHRSVRLERHSLLLIGALGGFLSMGTDWVITAERFPDQNGQAVALLIWLTAWLSGVSLLDHWLTRRARQRRDETMPFAQAQITRAWWMLLSVGALGSFAMFFYGGGQMVYALWIVLLGLGIYLFGLFSRPLVEWIGVAAILLGVIALAASLPFGATRWLNASCFAIGIPLAGWLAPRVSDTAWLARLGALFLWIGAVVTPALLAVKATSAIAPSGPVIAAGSAAIASGEQILRLEPGTRLPMRLDLEGPILGTPSPSALDVTLALPVELALKDGQLDGRYRLGEGVWQAMHQGGPRLVIDSIKVRLDAGMPDIRVHARLNDRSVRAVQP